MPILAAANDEPSTSGLLDVFHKRQTVRKYRSTPVPDEHVRAILDAARYAPTCMNQQPWKFLVVRDKAKIAEMRKRTLEQLEKKYEEFAAKNSSMAAGELAKRRKSSFEMHEGYFSAPVYVVILFDSECPCATLGARHDGPLAAGYVMLAARALGYGTVYLTDGVPDSVSREVLGYPQRYQRICMTPIGVPDGWPEPRPKKKLDELIAYETLTS
jgi:nitroreductase